MKNTVINIVNSLRVIIQRNALILLLVLFACIGLITFAWMSSTSINNSWKSPSLFVSASTGTSTPGWWSQIYTPTPQSFASIPTLSAMGMPTPVIAFAGGGSLSAPSVSMPPLGALPPMPPLVSPTPTCKPKPTPIPKPISTKKP